ncbi:MAG: hypothetical protein HC812_03915 [Leptolyngbya sp. RL_3_1]|nr:hypothetical protein [Leptolyngbya sp. RL_3_1]
MPSLMPSPASRPAQVRTGPINMTQAPLLALKQYRRPRLNGGVGVSDGAGDRGDRPLL